MEITHYDAAGVIYVHAPKCPFLDWGMTLVMDKALNDVSPGYGRQKALDIFHLKYSMA